MQDRQRDLEQVWAQPTQAHQKFSWRKPATYLSLVILGSGITVSGNYLLTRNPLSVQPANAVSTTQTPQTAVASLPPTTDTNFVTAVVEKVGPAVVRIDSSKTVTTENPAVFNDPFFRNFFGSEFPQRSQKQIERGTGSGFIMSADGRILTNAHVVSGADTVTVTLKDGRKFQGKVLGADPVTDVAVVKIQANQLPTESRIIKSGCCSCTTRRTL